MPITAYTPLTAAFIPSSIPGCAMWLDATDSTSYTLSGTTVTSWTDKANGIVFAQAQGTVVNTASAIGTKNAFAFNSGSLFNQTITFNNTAFTIFSITNGTSGGYGYILKPNYQTNANLDGTLFYGSYPDMASFNTSPANLGAGPWVNGINANTPQSTCAGSQLLGCVATGGSVYPYYNGTAMNAKTGTCYGNGTNSYILGVLVGDTEQFSQNWGGYIGEVIIYGVALTTAQRQQVEGYLAWKWGLQAKLPGSHPYAAAVPMMAAPAFKPTSITGCKVWLDGADTNGNGTKLSNGGTVSTWVDKSGNSCSPTATAGAYPTYSSVSNCVTWNGSANTQLIFPSGISNAVVGTAFTIFIVEQRTSGGENFIIRGTAGGNANLLIGYSGGNSAITRRFSFYGNDLDFAGLPSYTSGESASISCYQYSKPNRAIYNNGTLGSSDTNSSDLVSYAGAMIGGAVSWAGYSGNIFEIIMYNVAFTTAQRQQVEGYLAWKWGLQASLPGSHPYASTNPNPTINNKISAIPYYTQFSPLQIANCQLWLDASDSSTSSMTFSSGSNLSVWKDKSGKGNNFSLTTGTTTRINDGGYSVVNFPSGALMTSANQITFSSSSAFFIVCKTTSGFGYAVGFTNITSGDYGIRFINGVLQGTTAAQGYNVDDLGNTTYYVNGVFNLPTTTTTYNLINTTNPQYSGTTTLTLSTTYNSRYFVGTIAEFIYYPTGVTATQRQQLESYLAQKWGLTSQLPNFSAPTAITGCKLWLDANDPAGTGATPTNGQAITTWVNKTSGFLNLTGSASISTYGGRNSMSFTNALSLTTTTSSVPMTSVSCFMVWVQSTSYGNVALLNLGTNLITWQSDCIGFYSDASVTKPGGTPGYRIYSGSTTLTGTAYTTATTADAVPFHILEITIDASGNMTVYRNGTSFQTGTRPASWGGTLTVCGFGEDLRYNTPAGAAQASCFVSEVIAYNSVLTTTQRQQVEGYLAVKWGLQSSLPISHPYYATNPIHLNFTTVIGRDPIVAALVPTIPRGIGYVYTFYTNTKTFTYTGANQTFVVPTSINPATVTVYMWGAGGGGGHTGTQGATAGGAGAYLQGTLRVTPNNSLTIIVGGGGAHGSTGSAYGGGGSANASGTYGGGGGRSAIQLSGTELVDAGGGGGAGYDCSGGYANFSPTINGGAGYPGLTGASWPFDSGGGGTQTAGGAAGPGNASSYGTPQPGTYLAGGLAAAYAGAGGSGYYGGGGGNTNDTNGAGGGGGSSYTTNAAFTLITGSNSPNGYSAPASASPYYVSGIAAGSTNMTTGGNGLIVVMYTSITPPPVSSGGTVTVNGLYRVHSFTTVGTTTFTLSSPVPIQAQVLVVGGGGGGGGYYNGGGGGAGGAAYTTSFTIAPGSYTVTVGGGGTGQSGYGSAGGTGTSSSFSTLTGSGGGGGGSDNNVNGVSGGCGGGMGPLGATSPGSGTQGFAGGYGTNGPNMGNLGGSYGSGYGGGGGGGMGTVGSNALTSGGPGWGGLGKSYTVGGQSYLVAAGGGAGTADTDNTNFGLGGSSIGGNGGLNSVRVATSGATNTGSGGGGFGRSGTGSGGSGGSGIVILSFLN